MPTVIDSLVVELGLDTKGLTDHQRKAIDGFRKFQEELESRGKDVEVSSSRAGEAIGTVKTQVLELFAALGGAAAVVGFATKITTADAALGRVSRSVGASASEISKWQGAARIFGGDAQSMAQSFTTISDVFAGWKIGIVSPMIADLRAISTAGGKIIDVNKGVEQSLLDLSDNLKAIHDVDPARAGLLGRRLGLDPALLDLLLQGSAATKKILDQVRAIGVATDADANRAGDLAKAWNKVELAVEASGRRILNRAEPYLVTGLNAVSKDLTTSHPYGEGWRNSSSASWLDALKTGVFGRPATSVSSSPSTASGAFSSQAEKEAYIRAEAQRRGIDPNIAMAVARSEGFSSPIGDNGTSFGAFQVHVTPGGRGRAVGDEFRKQTGLNPANPANERATIAFALDDVRRNGWGAYHGAANSGIGAWAGVSRGGDTTTTTSEVNINGPITVHDSSGNANNVARGIAGALKRQSYAAQSNDGQN